MSDDNTKPTKKGSLIIVGSGIQAIRQFTLESRLAIEQADKVLYHIPDEISGIWINKINPNSESLIDCYVQGKPRNEVYEEMTERTLNYVRQGLNVCVVYYGHPGVFVQCDRTAQERGIQTHHPHFFLCLKSTYKSGFEYLV